MFVKPNKRPKGGLKIRETKDDGVYVQDLTVIPVTSYKDIADQIERGTSLRTIGATNMNATSSRAHTVTTITFNQTEYTNGKPTNKKRSNINLVDLAGSERARTTGADADRLKEGSNINKSLSFLGKVINILADKASGKKDAKKKVVPYRESKLTRILQNALGGNSKTAMIAALSPADVNFEETLSTLVYANQVKSIKNKAKINESPEDKLIRELKEENERLKKMFENKDMIQKEIIEDKKHDDELEGKVYIMNINEDPLLSGQIKHILNNGTNKIGKPGKGEDPDIKMSGIGMSYNHSQIKYDENTGELMLYPNETDPAKNRTHLNGDLISKPVPLQFGDRILFGNNNLYIVMFPGKQPDDGLLDYEDAMKEILKEQMDALRDEKYQKAMEDKLKKLKEEMEKERENIDGKFKAEQDKIDDAKNKLEEEMKLKNEELKKKLAEIDDDDEKMRELNERIRQQQEEAERLRREQEEKERQFRDERDKALKELEADRLRKESEKLHLVRLEALQDQLAKMIIMCNEANDIAASLGRDRYHYEPYIDTVIMPDGSTLPKVFCRAYPDKDKEFHNQLSFDEMEDKIYLIREKWEDYQYSMDNDGPSAKALEIDENEGEIWGLMVRDDWHLIGNVFIFMDSLALLMGTDSDEAPIIDTKGKEQGKLVYSLHPKVFDKDGNPQDTFLIESVRECYGGNMEVEFNIHQAKTIPEKYSNAVFAEYQWIDDRATLFETDRIKKRDTNPLFNYKRIHDIPIDNYIVENLSDTTCIISVYGKLTEENMEGLYKDFTARPETAQLVFGKTETLNVNEPFYKAAFGDKAKNQDVMILEDEDEQIESPSKKEIDKEKKQAEKEREKAEKEKLKELEKLKKELEKFNSQNERLENDITLISKGQKSSGSCCCIIF